MTMSLLPGLDCRLTSSPATEIFNSWTTDDGGLKKGEREREGRKNNPALSCQLSAANEPLLPSSCSRFQETAVRDQSHGSIPANKPFNFASPHFRCIVPSMASNASNLDVFLETRKL